MKRLIFISLLFWSPVYADTYKGLPIAPETGHETYDRDDYRHWSDEDGDRLDTRQEVLQRQSLVPVEINDRWKITSGLWLGVFSGRVFTNPRKLDVDHLVPLKEAHISGGHSWDKERKEAYANDLDGAYTLIAVWLSTNRSKGDKDPASWMPPNRSYWCDYLNNWVAVKKRWGLSIDPAEVEALKTGFKVCGDYVRRDGIGP